MAAATTRRDERTTIELDADQQVALLEGGIEPTVREPETMRSVNGEDAVETTRTRPAKLWMYSTEGIRKAIPGQDASAAYESGYRFTCPKCGTKCEGILKSCPAMEPPAWGRCPVPTCGKIFRDYQFHDNLRTANPEQPAGEEIAFEAATTPAQRLNEKRRRHMLARHPSESPMYGFFPDRTEPERR